MDIDTVKAICIVVQFITSFIIGCFPYFLVRRGESGPRSTKVREAVISYLKCFSGGVFMAACLLNLLPGGMKAMAKYFDMVDVKTEFPVFMVIAALGFFIIAYVEQLAHSLIHEHQHNSDASQPGGDDLTSVATPHSADNALVMEGLGSSTGKVSVKESLERHPVVTPGESKLCVIGDGRDSEHTASKDELSNNAVCYQHTTSNIIKAENQCQIRSLDHRQAQSHQNGDLLKHQNNPAAKGHDECEDIINVISGNPLRAFLLLTALSFHTIFDGLAVGLKTNENDVWEMFTAIVIHKALVSICLGIQLFLVYKDRPLIGVLWTAFFSSIAPIGLGIGMVLTSGSIDQVARQLANSFLQGLATGTFLYVTFFEILKEEIVDKRGFLRISLVLVGFAAMGLVKYACAHSHD